MAEDILVSEGWHWSFGWLRRPELDTMEPDGEFLDEQHYCYEMPDGELVFTPFEHHKEKMRLGIYVEADSGERYITMKEE